eukprot:g33013.t1
MVRHQKTKPNVKTPGPTAVRTLSTLDCSSIRAERAADNWKTCQTRRRTFGAYEEVPEAEPWDATSYEFFDFNTKNSSGWRSHQQGECCAIECVVWQMKKDTKYALRTD